jgi:hypothetical protein
VFKLIFDEQTNEENSATHKKKLFGNIKFVGALFKSNLITNRIISIIVHELLSGKAAADDSVALNEVGAISVEAACFLMENVGYLLDKQNNEVKSKGEAKDMKK